jgi:predicted nucleic acid-binding protein
VTTLVDSSVWVDFFRGTPSAEASILADLLDQGAAAVGDLILVEILRGFRSDRDFNIARRLLSALPTFELLGGAQAITSANHYRSLRRRGITVRRTPDAIIARFCISHGIPLLHNDRDFQPYEDYLGLRVVR